MPAASAADRCYDKAVASCPPMSEEQLKAFLEAVKADAGLQEKLKAAGDADAVAELAKAAGFAVSADELKRAQADAVNQEISEEELRGVSGGWITSIIWDRPGHPEFGQGRQDDFQTDGHIA